MLAPTDECPLYHRSDACTHIAGECDPHKNLSISRHNAACQLIHVAIRSSAKGGGALYGTEDLRPVAADAGNQNQTTEAELSLVTPSQVDMHQDHKPHLLTTEWLEPLPPNAENSAPEIHRCLTEPKIRPRKHSWRLEMQRGPYPNPGMDPTPRDQGRPF